jgi:hypothetical protein
VCGYPLACLDAANPETHKHLRATRLADRLRGKRMAKFVGCFCCGANIYLTRSFVPTRADRQDYFFIRQSCDEEEQPCRTCC